MFNVKLSLAAMVDEMHKLQGFIVPEILWWNTTATNYTIFQHSHPDSKVLTKELKTWSVII